MRKSERLVLDIIDGRPGTVRIKKGGVVGKLQLRGWLVSLELSRL